MREGVVFNPRYEACGFHPEEIVGRRRDLTAGQKWLYQRLVGWARATNGERPNERAGEVWRSCQNIADELGKSEKQIGRDMAKLEAAGLIGHHRRDGRKSNPYFFRFHHSFERTSTVQTQVETQFEQTSASVPTKTTEAPPANLNGHPRPVGCNLNGHPRPSNQKVFNQQEHILSRNPGRFEVQPGARSHDGAGPHGADTPTTRSSKALSKCSPGGGKWENLPS